MKWSLPSWIRPRLTERWVVWGTILALIGSVLISTLVFYLISGGLREGFLLELWVFSSWTSLAGIAWALYLARQYLRARKEIGLDNPDIHAAIIEIRDFIRDFKVFEQSSEMRTLIRAFVGKPEGRD